MDGVCFNAGIELLKVVIWFYEGWAKVHSSHVLQAQIPFPPPLHPASSPSSITYGNLVNI